MYRIIFISLGIALVVAKDPENMKKCGRLMHHSASCCNKKSEKNPMVMEDYKECFELAKKPPLCEMEKCIAQKMGLASSDGTIDKKAFVDIIDKNLGNDPDFADRLKGKCVNGDLSKYGSEDFCDLMKMKICIGVQYVKSCNDWKNDGDCEGIKDLAAECTKDFD